MEKGVKTLRNCIDEGLVNKGRQPEIDLARAIPVFCLPIVHTVIECTPLKRIYDPIPFFFNIVIGQFFGAPMFLFVMGVCILYSKKNTPRAMMLRGIILFIAGFVLNAVRFFIPFMIGYAITGDADKFLTPLPYKVFGNDVLQFAGLFFLLFGFLQYKKISDKYIFIIAALMSVLGSLIRHFDTGYAALNIALGHIIGTEDRAGLYVMSDFPLLNWFIVPIYGYLFGKLLLHISDKDRFYKIVAPVPLILYVVFYLLECTYDFGQMGIGRTILYCENCYYHALWYDTLGYAVFAVGILGVYYYLMKIFKEPVRRFVVSLSGNITRVYVIHWFFVIMITNVLLYSIRGTQDLPIVPTLLISFGIFMITYPLALLWERSMNKKKVEDR
ncbi:MAG: acyltransferase [Lachnospiraceae bacterium]|nr:acyltransferase [Lachnospiraceae bacterium]